MSGVIVVIAERSPFTGRLRRLTSQEVVGLRPTFTEHVLNSMLSTLRQIDLVVISEEVDEDQVYELTDIILHHAPHVPIVLVRDHADTLTQEWKAAGIREVLDSAGTDIDVERLLSRFFSSGEPAAKESKSPSRSIRPTTPPPAPAAPVRSAAPSSIAAERLGITRGGGPSDARPSGQPRVMVVLSPKGGVGKTTIATNLAVALGQKNPMEAVVVDYDAQFGDVASMLNVSAAHTIEEAFTESGVHPSLVLKGLLVTFEDSLLVMSGSDSPAAMEKVSSPQATQLIRQLSEEYPFVVVDTGSGLTDESLAALEVATDIIFVTTMDVSAVKALRRTIDLLDRLNLLPRHRYLLVNMADSGTGLTAEDIGAAMRMEVDAVIPRSTDVVLSVNVGKPLAVGRGSSPFMDAIEMLVAKVSGTAPRTTRGGLFRRGT